MTRAETLTPPAPKRSNAARLFGYDVFISFALGPPPRGTRGYSSDLARRLRELDFTVFFSEDEAPAGSQLDSTLRRALLRSRILVVVVNRATLENPRWVRLEVEEFRARHPGRAVIPISIDGALLDPVLGDAANEWLQFKDRIWIDESGAAVEAASVSADVLNRLATAPSSGKANSRWRRIVTSVWVVLVSLVVAVGFAWSLAVSNDARARAELRRATSLRLAGEAQVAMAAGSAVDDERALLQLLAAHGLHASPEVDGALLTSLHERRALLKLIPVGTAITTVAFHPDGRRVAAGTMELSLKGNNVLRMWETESGASSGKPFPRLDQPYLAVDFSPNGSITATGHGDTMLRFWNTETRELVGDPVRGSEGETVNGVVFDRDGSQLVSGSNDGLLAVWDVARRIPVVGPTKPGDGAILSVALSPDGSRVATAASNGAVHLWDRRSLQPIRARSMKHQGAVYSVAFSPDGATLASAGTDKTIRTWDARSGTPLGNDEMRHEGLVRGLAFSPDGRRLASVGDDRTVRLWDVPSRRLIGEPMRGHAKSVWAVAFGREGRLIASGSEDGTLRLWAGREPASLGRALEDRVRSLALAYGVDGGLAIAGENGWVLDAGRPSQRVVGASTSDVPRDAGLRTFSADGRRVAVVVPDQPIRVLDARSGEQVGGVIDPPARVSAVALNADGTVMAVGDSEKTIRLWNVATGRPLGQGMKGGAGDVTALAFAPDSKRLASASGGFWSQDTAVRLWDVASQSQVGEPLVGHRSTVWTLAFSPDGRRLASAGGDTERNDYSIRQWDVASGRQLGASLEGHGATVRALAFADRGRLILSGGADGQLRAWIAATGQPGPALPFPDRSIRHIAVSPDDAQIAASGTDGQTVVWPGPSAWPRLLCAKLTRNMSREEWRNWVSPEIDYVCQCPGLPVPPSMTNQAETQVCKAEGG